MKLPAVAIAASFVCGIVLGLGEVFARASASHLFLIAGFVAAALPILAGLLFGKTMLIDGGGAFGGFPGHGVDPGEERCRRTCGRAAFRRLTWWR